MLSWIKKQPLAKRILVIDDDPLLRDVLCQRLARAGYEVNSAADAEEANSLFVSFTPDVVITDIYMPNKDGLEVIMELRQSFPNLKIIAMSGGTAKEDVLVTASSLGASYTLVKPFEAAELLHAVQHVAAER